MRILKKIEKRKKILTIEELNNYEKRIKELKRMSEESLMNKDYEKLNKYAKEILDIQKKLKYHLKAKKEHEKLLSMEKRNNGA